MLCETMGLPSCGNCLLTDRSLRRFQRTVDIEPGLLPRVKKSSKWTAATRPLETDFTF